MKSPKHSFMCLVPTKLTVIIVAERKRITYSHGMSTWVASFPGPTPCPAFHRLQYRKAWRAWYLFPSKHDIIGKWRKFSEQTGCVLHIVQLTMLNARCIRQSSSACSRLPATLALFAFLGPVHPCIIKPFLPSFRHSREKRYQALSRFSILIATKS